MSPGRYRSATKALAKEIHSDGRRRKESLAWMTSSARVRAGGALDVSKPATALAVLQHSSNRDAIEQHAEDVPASSALEALASEAYAADVAAEIRERSKAKPPHPSVTEPEARRMLKPHFERRDLPQAIDTFLSLSDGSQRLVRALLTLTGVDAKNIVSLVRRAEYARAAQVAGRHVPSLQGCVMRSVHDDGATWPRVFVASV